MMKHFVGVPCQCCGWPCWKKCHNEEDPPGRDMVAHDVQKMPRIKLENVRFSNELVNHLEKMKFHSNQYKPCSRLKNGQLILWDLSIHLRNILKLAISLPQ